MKKIIRIFYCLNSKKYFHILFNTKVKISLSKFEEYRDNKREITMFIASFFFFLSEYYFRNLVHFFKLLNFVEYKYQLKFR